MDKNTEREALLTAVGGVLFNVSNYPEAAQSRLLGQDTRPLTEKVVDAVLAARGDAAGEEHDDRCERVAVLHRLSGPCDCQYRARHGAEANRMEGEHSPISTAAHDRRVAWLREHEAKVDREALARSIVSAYRAVMEDRQGLAVQYAREMADHLIASGALAARGDAATPTVTDRQERDACRAADDTHGLTMGAGEPWRHTYLAALGIVVR